MNSGFHLGHVSVRSAPYACRRDDVFMLSRNCLCLLLFCFAVPAVAEQTCRTNIPRVAPDSRYVASEPDDPGHPSEWVVNDLESGLMWARCAQGQAGAACSGVATQMNWSEALDMAKDSDWAGFSDWRLPNIAELASLVESGCHGPAINENFFPNAGLQRYWTSTTPAWTPTEAWYVDFNTGLSSTVEKTKRQGQYVRLVRGGAWVNTRIFRDGFEGSDPAPE